MKQYNCDRIQLLETSPGYILEEIDQEVSLISPKSDVPWYLNHQTSIWKINSLDSVVTSNDCATVSEMVGSERCKELKYKFYVLNKPLTLSSGVNHSIDGLYEHGKIMLQEFCREKNISYVDYLKKFKISKIKKLIANFKSILIKIFKKIKYVRDN